MDPGQRGWPPAPPPPQNPHGVEQQQNQAAPQRPAFGAGQQSPPQGHSGLPPPPPPPGGPFPHFHNSGPSLASLAGLSQSSPRQAPPQPPPGRQEGPQDGPQLPLPGFSQATGQIGASERDRPEAADGFHIKREEGRRHFEDMERERLDRRDRIERERLEHPAAHQTHPGPQMPLHQPVAVGPRSVHGPNGLLANPGPPQPQMPPGAPSGPGNVFVGGPVQPNNQPPGPTGQQMQTMVPYGPGQQAQAASAPQQQQHQQQGQNAGQGQQPILNDALSYLDQVKVQFAEVPDVYNRFLDIMKDFKSGAIDTPGVIGRVSTLFSGNPELIQGFNTFLPPGYRIECGSGNDPNIIRVTTPHGTEVMQQRPSSRQDGELGIDRATNGSYTPQPGPGAQVLFSPSARPVGAGAPPPSHLEVARHQEQQAMHQQEQRGVSSLSNAASAVAANAGPRPGASPRTTPLPGQQDPATAMDGLGAQQGIEKRGPVEFNHAISYVNKIKNRFASHPDIYKQFLEILQTYQRESKPIQDVYSQVTHLFKTAPDLLEDFKQFLPESAAQAKAAETARRQAEENIMLSNVRGEGMYGSPTMSREAHVGTPTHPRANLPPVGNFAPTPIGKDNNKRKRGDRQGAAVGTFDPVPGPSGAKAGAYGAQTGKRLKSMHPQTIKAPSEQLPTSPTLIPRLPEPMPPTTTSAATHEELNFFDRAKKAIGNKNTMNEFLKLCNLFSNDFIDGTTLAFRARTFLGNNPELMKWFADFIGYEDKDVAVDNKAREPLIPGGRISLSNCRGLGPSYRLLPKRERNRPCSGRDELCNSVLNDEWASHPTWASEDSGFIAHRKNVHEEGLHRIEEERHDYDYNIEACSKTIQLLEPIAQQLRRMSNEEQTNYTLPNGLGGQSETIYKRVIMKLYGREKGHEVIEELHRQPYSVIPVLLNRLRERVETWKLAQREWEKVWREQTQKMFWKSLDHQAVNARTSDRRQFQAKILQGEMQVRLEEQKKEEQKVAGSTRGQPQLMQVVIDEDVLVDAAWLLLLQAEQPHNTDYHRLAPFVKEFIPLFFGISEEDFERKLAERRRMEDPDINGADEPGSGAEDSGSERRPKKNGKQSNLLRQTLDKGPKGRQFGRKDREDSNASASRATTPGPASEAGDEGAAIDGMTVEAPPSGIATPAERAGRRSDTPQRWFNHPEGGNLLDAKDVGPNEQHKRTFFRLWANGPIYCFVRMFLIMYERLHRLKMAEPECRDLVRNAMKSKAAIELGIVDKLPQDFFGDTSRTANYYQQMLHKFYDVLQQEIEFVNDGVEECLRRFYLQAGYPMYAFEKMVTALAKYGALVVNQEGGNKEKTWDVVALWKRDKAKGDETNAQQTMDYRKAAEKLMGGQEVYAIDWEVATRTVKFYLVKKDDTYATAPSDSLSELDRENLWRYYVASYSSVEPTEGVDYQQLRKSMLGRNMSDITGDPVLEQLAPPPAEAADAEGQDATTDAPGADEDRNKRQLLERFWAADNLEELTMRVALNNYAIRFQPGTSEGHILPMKLRQGGEKGVQEAERDAFVRKEGVAEHLLLHNDAVQALQMDEVGEREAAFAEITGRDVKVEDGQENEGVVAEGDGEAMVVDD